MPGKEKHGVPGMDSTEYLCETDSLDALISSLGLGSSIALRFQLSTGNLRQSVNTCVTRETIRWKREIVRWKRERENVWLDHSKVTVM